MTDPDEKNKGGRPPKLTIPVKLKVYALHLKKFYAHEIKKILGEQGIDLCEDSIRTAIRWARDEVPRTGEKETLLESIDSCRTRIKELHVRSARMKGDDQTHIWLGLQRQIGDEEERLAKLEGNLKVYFGVDADTMEEIAKLMYGRGEKGGDE